MPEIGEVISPQADIVSNTEWVPQLPDPGQALALDGVLLTLDRRGLFGTTDYRLEACNGDGIDGIAMRGGRLYMDFCNVSTACEHWTSRCWTGTGPATAR